MFPPLSFFIPTLYNVKARAVGINPNNKLKSMSFIDSFNKSVAPKGRKTRISKRVDHHDKKISKLPFACNLLFSLYRLL